MFKLNVVSILESCSFLLLSKILHDKFSVDPEDTCAGEICRLDKAFAEELNEIWEWSKDLEVSSGFNREDACISSSGKLFLICRITFDIYKSDSTTDFLKSFFTIKY